MNNEKVLSVYDISKRITITIHVKGMRAFFLGLWLIRLGCWISGISYDGIVEEN